MTMSAVTDNAKNLFQKLVAGYQYTFKELSALCDYTHTELCLALLYLIKEGKMKQYRLQEVYSQAVD